MIFIKTNVRDAQKAIEEPEIPEGWKCFFLKQGKIKAAAVFIKEILPDVIEGAFYLTKIGKKRKLGLKCLAAAWRNGVKYAEKIDMREL